MRKIASIERKSYENVVAKSGDFRHDYDTEYLLDMAKKEIEEAIEDYENSRFELDELDSEEIASVKVLYPGHYLFDCGDYSYRITIKDISGYDDAEIIDHGDIVYLLQQEAYLDGTHEEPLYRAFAIDVHDDEYEVQWEPVEGFEDIEDAHDHCDWDNPDNIERI